ncbi:MAG: thiamine phosphate synthase [Chitinophagales bacterium]
MKLIVYTIPYDIKDEVKTINRLFEDGLDNLHVRKPGFSASTIKEMIKGIDPQFHQNLVLHSHYHLALTHDIKGIHLSNPNFFIKQQYAKLLKLKKNDLQVASTVHDIHQTTDINSVVDYAMVGPLYTKYSEENKKTNFNRFELAQSVQNASKKLIALGGISIQDIPLLQQIGFAGVALQSAIWKSTDANQAFNAFKMSIAKEGEFNRSMAI